MSSTHKAEVVRIKLEEHPNADALSIVHIHGWTCVVRTEDWEDGDLAVYVEPDSIVPDTPEFAFLKSNSKNWNRIRARKFRGIISLGLLVPAPEGAKEGDDVMEQMGITHYEPPEPFTTGGEDEPAPPGYYPKYDVENFNRYGHVLIEGEEVIVTEKIHGASCKICHIEDRMWVSSRNHWKRYDEKNLWWRALKQNSWIEEFCKKYPGFVLYGEVFGNVQKLKYGAGPNDFFFRAFDILQREQWCSIDEVRHFEQLGGFNINEHWVPILYEGPFEEKRIRELALGNSSIPGANHMREGVVIRPKEERTNPEIGRVQLKIVSPRYLSKE